MQIGGLLICGDYWKTFWIHINSMWLSNLITVVLVILKQAYLYLISVYIAGSKQNIYILYIAVKYVQHESDKMAHYASV